MKPVLETYVRYNKISGVVTIKRSINNESLDTLMKRKQT